jgi:hypothetical protein
MDQYNYKPLDESAIKWHVENELKILAAYKKYFLANKRNFVELWYEDLFCGKKECMEVMKGLFNFLGVSACVSKAQEKRILAIASPGNKMTTAHILSRIPNYSEVMSKFEGSLLDWPWPL